jgi:hypothetical protein
MAHYFPIRIDFVPKHVLKFKIHIGCVILKTPAEFILGENTEYAVLSRQTAFLCFLLPYSSCGCARCVNLK